MNTDSSIRITGICGSLVANGSTKKALTIALSGAAEFDAETTLLELRDIDLVFYGSVTNGLLTTRKAVSGWIYNGVGNAWYAHSYSLSVQSWSVYT